MLVYIAGSGAMGCRFGYQLSKTDNTVILLDNWEEHIEAIQNNGLLVTGDVEETVNLPILKPTQATQEADLIILFTKAMQLPQMLADIQNIIGPKTKVLCLLNGLGHEEVIRNYISNHNIIMGVTIWTAGLKGPGQVCLKGTGTIDLQSIDPTNKEAGERIVSLLNAAHLNATYDEDVIPSIWRKACVNGADNTLCALLDCKVGQLVTSQHASQIIKDVLHEFVVVGRSEGISLDEEKITEYVFKSSVNAAHHYPSMHQDLVQHHRPTEVDFLNGAIVKKGEQLGIDTPYCRLITQLIHAKEDILKIK